VTQDLNDQARSGSLPGSPRAATRPMNAKAEEAEENRPLRVFSVKDLLADSVARAQSPLDLTGICPTGHYLLDDYTAGMRPGFTWVIAADTSVGKSSFIISVADETIKAGKRVLIVSSEDAENIYGDRLMARRSRVNADSIRKRKCTQEEKDAMLDVERRAEDVPVFCHALGRKKKIELLEKELDVIIAREKINAIMFDYLQEFESTQRHQDERVKFKHIASRMRGIIKRHRITGAILSQMTISAETKVPTKANIRECKDVANGAEVIVIIFKPEEDIKGPSPGKDERGYDLKPEIKFKKGVRYALIDKNKDGPAGKKVALQWNEHSACFDTVKDPEVERLAKQEEEFGFDADEMDVPPRQHEFDNFDSRHP
jgi:replicative DNA helicase